MKLIETTEEAEEKEQKDKKRDILMLGIDSRKNL